MTLADRHYLDDLRSLRARQEQLNAVFDAARDAMVIADDNGTVLDANHASTELFGGRPDQLRGRSLRDIVNQPVFELSDGPRDGSGAWERDLELVRPDGSVRVVEYRTRRNILPGRHLSILRDVTADRESDLEREHLIAAAEAADDAIVGVALDGRITAWNAAAMRLYGWPRGEAIGTHVSRLVPPHRQAELADLLTQVVGGARAPDRETVHCHAEGRPLDVCVSLSPIRGAGGRVIGASMVVREIERDRGRQHRASQAERLESLGRLAGGVAHDFNNVLSAIIGYADLLLRDLGPEAAAGRRDALEIRRAADRATRLTSQLLAFSRRKALEPAPVEVRSAIDDILPLLRRLISGEIEIRVLHRAPACWVRMDPGQLEQVVLNLVLNGRDAMEGGGLLTIETSVIELEDADASAPPGIAPGPYVRLAVADTGSGIGRETLEHIFEPFFTTKATGTGLGLATVYGVVQAAGGQVSASSEVGRGSTFTVYLPLVDDPARSEPSPGAQPASGGETILLLETDAAARALARSVLEQSGYRVLAAADPGQALALALDRCGSIDLLVTDLILPAMSGPQLAQQLAAIGCTRRVLYLSGPTEPADGDRVHITSDGEFLRKPFTADALARRVRAILGATAR